LKYFDISIIFNLNCDNGFGNNVRRERRRDGGYVIDVRTGAVVVAGLSMPHSPRWYRGRRGLLDLGAGQFGRVDPGAGRFWSIAFCPGYLRGLTFVGDYAVVMLSKPRHDKTVRGASSLPGGGRSRSVASFDAGWGELSR
jgi:uncharacterized protein (TIGR03032 family)